MRSPRALIPLLSICAAAAVVTAAATGASIEGLPGGGGSALADGAVTSPKAVTIKAMTWNVCGDAEPDCPLGAAPDRLTKEVAERMRTTEVGGREVTPNAVLLQEVCEGHVSAFKKVSWLSSWTWAFAAPSKGPSCSNGEGRRGVAIATEAPLVEPRSTNLPGRAQIALCGEVPSWATRVCVTRLETGSAETRRKQAAALAELAGGGRVLFGGDLGDTPDSSPLDPLYRSYAECDQSGTSRSGAGTRQDWTGAAVAKTDYLFISRSAAVSCSVPTERVKTSDHRPLSAVVRYR
ncbi:endonuclease/exonuclease/phosphatase family metal-dependent hydrolase [Actinomadura pelletieri DSM 43383]|uniref:Endonuclease/exonuclease/phosphatase family metal-dependent hydrolase n=1 Tax=Actinomadura pelletieri DSM 43383 TaxID=1120940 RepID=A0A495QZ50_9ACTN|nr:endonuclease/exonuclease/phosphatase family protein [Actinomadura pelletieri]RKS79412.1 endonuclease/exonuclease/phosphatase family metal-dependent hydrolase [Actinomadura pelletieri DSM 43383]